MGEWSTGTGGASGPWAAECGAFLARVDSRTLTRFSFPIGFWAEQRPSPNSASSAHSDLHHFRNRLVDRDAIRSQFW